MKREETVRRKNMIFLLVAVALVAAGFIYGYTRPAATPEQPPVAASVQQPQREAQASPATQPAGASEEPSEPSTQAPAGTALRPSVANVVEPDASEHISENHYINICVEIVIAAQGFKNVGQGNEELITYIPELLADEGVTEGAFEQATERISSDPQQAERVAKEILKRVEARTGLQMDLTVLPIMNPDMAGETQ